MKVLHVATTLDRGGAANSLRLLHEALLARGHASRILTGRKSSDRSPQIGPFPPLPAWGRIPYHGLNLLGFNYIGLPTTGRLLRHPWFREADVVHYHNLHGGYFNYLALPKLTAAKPTVWTLRDMWGLTGHCAYSLECGRWRSGCGQCPHLDIDPPMRMDRTRWEWRWKRRVYQQSRIHVTAPSRWLAELARESILSTFPIEPVANAVDTGVFQPGDRPALRRGLGWPAHKTVLLFAAESTRNPVKGFDLLQEALRGLSGERKRHLFLAIMGDAREIGSEWEGMEATALGYVGDDADKARLYAAADMFVFPTRADNQPRVLLEAMACGTPPVSTAVGGVPELVGPETGWLAPDGDAGGVRRGIELLMDDPELRDRLGRQGREIILREHAVDLHVRRMLAVYGKAVAR